MSLNRPAVITCQGDIVELRAEGLSLSGAVLKNFASNFCSLPFASELYKAYFRALASTNIGLRMPTSARSSYCQPRVKRLFTLPFNYKLYKISDFLLISEE